MGPEKIRKVILDLTIHSIKNDYMNKIKMDLPYQRGLVWKNEQKSLLIHSILIGFPIPDIILVKQDEYFILVDGKQRLRTIFDYIDESFRLDPNTPKVFDEPIANKNFSELPAKLQHNFLNERLRFIFLEDVDLEEISELFVRLNNTNPVSMFAKQTYRSPVRDQVIQLVKHPFFKSHYPMPAALKGTHVDQQLIVITSMLLEKELPLAGISIRDTEKYLDILAKENRSIKKEAILLIADYMEEVSKRLTVREKRKIYKKVDTIPIMLLAYKVKDEVIPKRFAEFLISFYIDQLLEYPKYNLIKKEGFNKISNIQRRLEILQQALMEYLSN